MKISIIGAGYVGLVTGIGLAELGNKVVFVDIDPNKLDKINRAEAPIFEEKLQEMMSKNKTKYYATDDYNAAIKDTDVTFICVGTPSNPDGSINLQYVKTAAEKIGFALKNKNNFHVVVVKSTVIPGTTESIVKPILERTSGKNVPRDIGLAMNPEFLREGTALYDFFNPDRIIIGTEDSKTRDILNKLYDVFKCPKMTTHIKVAEMIKYASNAFLGTKISFANEVGNICKQLGIDSYEVFQGVGLDHRISPYAFKSGIGFGGSCFPKDIQALIQKAKELGVETKILNAVIEVNDKQPLLLIDLLKKHISDLHGRTIGILGLAFKPNSDDIRESRAIPIIKKLLKENVDIVAYDPKAMENFKKIFPQIKYVDSSRQLLESCDIIMIATDWPEFEKLNYSGKIVIDGRRINAARKTAKIYEGVCW